MAKAPKTDPTVEEVVDPAAAPAPDADPAAEGQADPVIVTESAEEEYIDEKTRMEMRTGVAHLDQFAVNRAEE